MSRLPVCFDTSAKAALNFAWLRVIDASSEVDRFVSDSLIVASDLSCSSTGLTPADMASSTRLVTQSDPSSLDFFDDFLLGDEGRFGLEHEGLCRELVRAIFGTCSGEEGSSSICFRLGVHLIRSLVSMTRQSKPRAVSMYFWC